MIKVLFEELGQYEKVEFVKTENSLASSIDVGTS